MKDLDNLLAKVTDTKFKDKSELTKELILILALGDLGGVKNQIYTEEIKNDKNITEDYVYDSYPFMSIDIWINECDIFIDHKNIDRLKSFISNSVKSKIVIGLKTDLLFDYIHILSNINRHFILITLSNDDHCVPYLNTNYKVDKNIILDIYRAKRLLITISKKIY